MQIKSIQRNMTSTSTVPIDPQIVVNKTRIRDVDGFVATVRYVGPVASAKNQNEIYAGVEWDDEQRGIHDGSVICKRTNQLVRHFHLKKSLNGGSFLRLNKLDLGVELEANLLLSRYVEPDAPLVAPNNLLPYSARTSSGREKPIEFWGEMKVRQRQQLEDLQDISLRGMGIRGIVKNEDERSKLTETFGHIKEIDVAGNLFCDWNDVLDTLRTFPNLVWLSFAANKIQDIPRDFCFQTKEFALLKVLNINNCGIESFDTVKAIDQMCPTLEELCVAYNDLSDMKSIDPNNGFQGFHNLKIFDCSSCEIESWSCQIQCLRTLSKLETLILDDNPIESVDIQDPDKDFVVLQNLQISGTKIKSWKDIECLSSVKSLNTLRFRKSPLTDDIGSGEARAGTIARLPRLKVLNASQISEKERIEAERRYVSHVARDIYSMKTKLSSDGNQNSNASVQDQFLELKLGSKYPMFLTLMEKHKESMLLSQSNTNHGRAIENSAVDITIKSMAAESCTLEPLKRRLPTSLKVSRLKMMCARAFGLDVDLQSLHFRSECDAFPIELDDDDNTLSYYGVSDGAEVLMNEIDVAAKKLEEIKKKKDIENRIETEERNAVHAVKYDEIRAQTIAAQKASEQVMR
jgi:tubulin-specific chaperone E